jgi:hypothetical protein
MQFYLDKKFINKAILHSLNSTDKLKTKFCLELIDSIKEYFQLYDIIIMQPTNLEGNVDSNSFRNQVKILVNNKYESLKLKPSKDSIITDTIKIMHSNFQLYFYPNSYEDNNKRLIICATKPPHTLNKDDIASIEIVINLLRLYLNNAL